MLLRNPCGDTVEVFGYRPARQPGYSWEKVDPEAANWAPTLVEGGTPGRPNSVQGMAGPAAEGIEIEAAPNPFAQTLELSYRLPAAPALVNL